MYKIYINKTKLLLIDSKTLSDYVEEGEDVLISPYTGKQKSLFNYIDMFEKSNRIKMCIIHSSNCDALIDDFTNLFKEHEAGGGLVQNREDGKYLFIFRRGHWDLPKGKMEKGESIEETSIREVEEETGVRDIELGDFITTTYHTYRNKSDKRCIKVSHWYKMYCDKQNLIPQTEEDIEQAEWITIDEFRAKSEPTYDNIRDVINTLK